MIVIGFCPTLGKENSINIDYIPSPTLSENSYIKGRYECHHASYGGECRFEKCPIYESAPEHKR